MTTFRGDGYRWLGENEILEVGDEFFCPHLFKWIETVDAGLRVGRNIKHQSSEQISGYRRKVDIPASSVDLSDPGDGWRFLEPGEDVQRCDEYIVDGDTHGKWKKVHRNGPQSIGCTYRRKHTEGEADRDPVNSPAHYTSHASGVECICITEHMNFCLGNAIKYIWRADEKDNALEDLKKARYYIEREIAKREESE